MSLQRRSTVFIIHFEYISYLFIPFSSVSTVGFEQVNVCLVPLYQFINAELLTTASANRYMYKKKMWNDYFGLWSEIAVPKNIFPCSLLCLI